MSDRALSLYIIIYIQQRRREPHLYSLCLRSYFLFPHFSLSLSLIPFGCLRLCKYIQTQNHKKEKKRKKRTFWLFHEMVNLMGIDSRLASQPVGNDFHLSAVPEFCRKPPFLTLPKKKKTNARQQQLSFLIYQRRPYSTVCFEICIESKMMTIPLVSSCCQRTFRFPPETWDENPRESRH